MILKQGFDGAADTSSHRFGLSPFFLDGVKIRRIRRKIKQYVPIVHYNHAFGWKFRKEIMSNPGCKNLRIDRRLE